MTWIKFDITTAEKPEVWRIAVILQLDPDTVVGKLLRIWAWFDAHTIDGNAPSVTTPLLNRLIGVDGFVQAMIEAGWAIDDGKILKLPNFTRHNGQTTKQRLLTSRRVESHKAKSNAKVTQAALTAALTPALPREEKRRVDSNNPSHAADAVDYASLETPPTWSQYRDQILTALAEFNNSKVSQGWQPISHTRLAYLIRSKQLAGWSGDRFLAAIVASIAHNCRTIRESKLDADQRGARHVKPDRVLGPLKPPPPKPRAKID